MTRRAVVAALLALGLVGGAVAPAVAAPSAVAHPVVVGNRLVDEVTGLTWVPRGVNWPSFEYSCAQGWNNAGGRTPAAAAAVASWGINVVRVPLNQDCWLGENSSPYGYWSSTTQYKAAVRNWVDTLAAEGIVTILDLHSFTTKPGSHTVGQRAMPNAKSLTFWSSVAGAYASTPNVIFDVYNEPYSRWNNATNTWAFNLTWDCWKNGGCQAPIEDDYTGTLSGTTYETVGMSALVAAVRTAGAEQPIMLAGRDYANDLSGWLAHKPNDTQLVAAWHNYPGQVNNTAAEWNANIAPVAAVVPVFMGEIGQTDGSASYLEASLDWADAHGIGYAPWAWWKVSSSESVENSRYALVDGSGDTYIAKAPAGTFYKAHLAAIGPGPLPSGPPRGAVESVTATKGRIAVAGWALDPDTTAPISVRVTLDGATKPAVVASLPSAAAQTAYPYYGANHGFATTLSSVKAGKHTVCVVALDPAVRTTTSLGCRAVTVPTR